jgi:hypothetical protein
LVPPGETLLEIGGHRLAVHLRAAYAYTNLDIVSRQGVDRIIAEGRLDYSDCSAGLIILSYVLTEIVSLHERLRLLTELYRCVRDDGRLLLVDDFDWGLDEHLRLNATQYFHTLRLGRPTLNELGLAGWSAEIVRPMDPDLGRWWLDESYVLGAPFRRAVTHDLRLRDMERR